MTSQSICDIIIKCYIFWEEKNPSVRTVMCILEQKH